MNNVLGSHCRNRDDPGLGIPWAALALFLVFACWAGWSIPLGNDVSWQYWIARQLRGGAVLYRDIIEVNPPLWFWEAVPISALGDRLRIDPAHLVILSVMIRATLALGLTAKLIEDVPARAASLLLVGLALLLCLLPVHDFAEREHLMLIGAIPYTVLIARRRVPARPISPAFAAIVGAYAGYGFAMKPHFALVPLALELWLAFGLRRQWRPLRPETLTLIVIATSYTAAILLFAPDYVRVIVPLARTAYGAFSPPFAWLFLQQIWMPTWLLALLAFAGARRALPVNARAAIVAASALIVIYLVQGKRFSYHALPPTAMLGWALLWLLAENGVVRTAIRHPLTVLALAALVVTGIDLGTFRPVRAGRATAMVERLPAGSVVAVVSAHSWLGFPLVEDRRFVWPMRTMALWTIPKIARDDAAPAVTPEALALRRRTLDMIAVDLWCRPPDAILVDDPARSPALSGTRFDYLSFVRSDPRLRRLLSSYKRSLTDYGTSVYVRRGPIAPFGTDCRTISVRPDFS